MNKRVRVCRDLQHKRGHLVSNKNVAKLDNWDDSVAQFHLLGSCLVQRVTCGQSLV